MVPLKGNGVGKSQLIGAPRRPLGQPAPSPWRFPLACAASPAPGRTLSPCSRGASSRGTWRRGPRFQPRRRCLPACCYMKCRCQTGVATRGPVSWCTCPRWPRRRYGRGIAPRSTGCALRPGRPCRWHSEPRQLYPCRIQSLRRRCRPPQRPGSGTGRRPCSSCRCAAQRRCACQRCAPVRARRRHHRRPRPPPAVAAAGPSGPAA
mmetsp:Transcript_43277/g.108450  ORF Transcript_43277/g.108450 Transcript_43277/m.108450 type:complete len:206 (+) Transcript_43277:122-739(+)